MLYKSIDLLNHEVFDPDNPVTELYGEKVPGDSFYNKSDGLHTIQYAVNNFVGTIAVQACIVMEPTESDWFTVFCKDYDLSGLSTSGMNNVVGTYIWLRAVVYNWSQGAVLVCRMTH